MKKILLTLNVIVFTAVGYSQTGVQTNGVKQNKTVVQKDSVKKTSNLNKQNPLNLVNKNKIEKIQTTVNGEVIYQQDYKPVYPINVTLNTNLPIKIK